MKSVAISKCPDYEIHKVRQAVREALGHIGGISAFVSPGDRVLLKANLLMRRKPEKATTTHPAVVQAVAELVVEAGGKPVICDSPGGYTSHSVGTLDSVYEFCGMKDAAKACGAELSYDVEVVDTALPQGRIIKSLRTIRPVLQADKIINLPKLKTHMMMAFSGAVKNLFGVVPGSAKTEYHFRFENEQDFAGVIVDICEFVKPTLTVMDAVVGMEGSGPTNGNPRQVGLILASADPYALDVAAAAAVGLEPMKLPLVRESARRGLCSGRPEDVQIAGERLDAVVVKNFQLPANHVAINIWDWILPKSAARRVNKAFKFKPRFRHERCRGCGVCARSCPARAISMKDGRPGLELNKCISCFCCHELCNFDAVDVTRPWLFKVLFR